MFFIHVFVMFQMSYSSDSDDDEDFMLIYAALELMNNYDSHTKKARSCYAWNCMG